MPLSADELERAAAEAIVGGGLVLSQAKTRVEKGHSLVIMPDKLHIALPCPDLPEQVLLACKSVMVCVCGVGVGGGRGRKEQTGRQAQSGSCQLE